MSEYYKKFLEIVNPDYFCVLEQLKEKVLENHNLLLTLNDRNFEIDVLNLQLDNQNDDIKMLMASYKEQKELENEQESYWNNKRPKISKYYNARPVDGFMVSLDPRIFFDSQMTKGIKLYLNGTNDEKAIKCLNWVIKNIKYISDKGEFWQYSYETLTKLTGDCEDGGILLANMMLYSGIPYWRIRLNAGDVTYQGKTAGHAYVTYLADSGDWYALDWCYYPEKSQGLGLKWDDAKDYLGIWFSLNNRYIFGDLPKNEKN